MGGALHASYLPWEIVAHHQCSFRQQISCKSVSLVFLFYFFSQILAKRPEAHLREVQKEGWGLRSPLSRFAFAQVTNHTTNW